MDQEFSVLVFSMEAGLWLLVVQALSSLPVFRLVSSCLFYIARDLGSTFSLPAPSLEASLLLPLRDVVLPCLLAPLLLLDVALQAVLLSWALTFQALLYLVYIGLFVSCHLTGNMSRLEKPGSYRASNTFDSNNSPSNSSPSNTPPSNTFTSNTFTSNTSPTSNSPSNNSPSNNSPSNNSPSNNSPSNNSPSKNSPSNNFPSNNSPLNNSLSNKKPSNNYLSNNSPSKTSPSSNSPLNNSHSNKSPSNKFSPITTSSPSIKKVAKREGDESGYVTEEVEE